VSPFIFGRILSFPSGRFIHQPYISRRGRRHDPLLLQIAQPPIYAPASMLGASNATLACPDVITRLVLWKCRSKSSDCKPSTADPSGHFFTAKTLVIPFLDPPSGTPVDSQCTCINIGLSDRAESDGVHRLPNPTPRWSPDEYSLLASSTSRQRTERWMFQSSRLLWPNSDNIWRYVLRHGVTKLPDP
jgi:hypothetical protein